MSSGALLAAVETVANEGGSIVLDGLRVAAIVLVALGSAVAALGVIWKSRIGGVLRWIVNHVVTTPLNEWHRGEMTKVINAQILPDVIANRVAVEAIAAEFRVNSGASLRDSVNVLMEGQKTMASNQELMVRRLDVVEGSMKLSGEVTLVQAPDSPDVR